VGKQSLALRASFCNTTIVICLITFEHVMVAGETGPVCHGLPGPTAGLLGQVLDGLSRP
jgi:hypothetical protein